MIGDERRGVIKAEGSEKVGWVGHNRSFVSFCQNKKEFKSVI